ncbi:SusC/RagA family TonB-linked outer membrane protein [Parapedobacter tibetensis]|uniref:SusC/RagA family TonB-linked outer membrane protein n=1 Tax=Parapedobacter tibetensis TaxID=2972951 RepID=UPI00214D5254|nr:TonB-dependent receptor [Parapedobacter tibetensis]
MTKICTNLFFAGRTRVYFPLDARLFFWVLMMVLPFSNLHAQDMREVRGKVVNSVGREPMPDVTVVVVGTNRSTHTSGDGLFSIMARQGNQLQFRRLGFATQEVSIGAEGYVEVELTEDLRALDEVTIVGYGRMKKTDLSSSQVSISAEQIQRTVNTTLEQALQGRAANVLVTSSGQPGAAPSVIIRGLNSVTGNNQPLYVIDGVQIKPSNPGETSGFNSLAGINPDDIESINVLQGPSATSIFGSAGASGVVMITTKRGKSGETKINASTLMTMQDVPAYMPVMNLREWAEFRNAYAAAGAAAADVELSDPSVLGEGTNWQRELFRKTLLQKHSLNLSGGNDKTTFYFSTEYFKQEGVVLGSGFDRASVRLNLDNQTRQWLKIGTNMNVNQAKEVINVSSGRLLHTAISQNPSIPVRNPDGSWGGPISTQFQSSNPIALASINDNRNRSRAFWGGAYADVNIISGLVWHSEVNGRIEYTNSYSFNPSYQFGGYVNDVTKASRDSGNSYWYNVHNRVQYDKQFGQHSLNAMVAHEAQEWGSEGLSAAREQFVSNLIPELGYGDASTATNGSSRSDGARESFFGRLNYVFNDRYIAQLTYRADGSSDFGPDNRWGYFPSGSVAWRVSNENFMSEVKRIDELKLRVEYGLSGNSQGSGYFARLQTVPTPWGTGLLAQNFANPTLGWETAKTFNVGFDLHMFNNRLEVIADAYVKNISDLLTTNQYPYYSGGDIAYSPGYIQFPTTNVGSMRNRGFGVTLNSVNIRKNNFEWRTSANISVDRNKITMLRDENGMLINYEGVITQTRVGHTAALITGYIHDGLFGSIEEIQNHAAQTTNPVKAHPEQASWIGDIKFRDVNNDGVVDELDRVVIGNPWPKFTFGFNNALAYKGFELNIFFTGAYGNDVYNFTRATYGRPGSGGVFNNYFKEVANFARPSTLDAGSTDGYLTNPGHNITRIVVGDPNGNGRINDAHIEDGSYIRLKNAALSYVFPKSFYRNIAFIGNIKAGINVQNVFTITKYKGYDPEVGMFSYGGSLVAGIDNGRYPPTRMYSFNLSVDF